MDGRRPRRCRSSPGISGSCRPKRLKTVVEDEAMEIDDAIWGIWFEDRTECLRLTETIQSVLREVAGQESESMSESDSGYFGRVGGACGGGSGVVVGGSVVGGGVGVGGGGGSGPGGPGGPGGGGPRPPAPGMNILSLLSNAQNKYEQEHGASHDQGTEPRAIHHASAGDASGMSQISLDDLFRTVNKHQAKAGLRDSSTATSNPHLPKNPPLGRSISVSEVEAQVKVQAPEPTPAPPNPAATQDSRHPLLRLISSKTVEEIERQHIEDYNRAKVTISGGQSSIPAEAKPASGKSSRSPGGATDSSSVDLMSLLGQGDSASNRSFKPVSQPSVVDLEHSLSSVTFPVMPDAPLAESIHGAGDRSRQDSTSGMSVTGLPTPTFLKPSDLDPSLAGLKSANRGPLPLNGRIKSPSSVPFLTPQAFADIPSVKPDSMKPLLPAAIPSPPSPTASSVGSAHLTKEQLQQALIHMVKNDSDFVNSLHTAYLESFQTSTGKKS